MTKKEKALNIFKTYFPYLVIVIMAALSTFIYFLPGIASGDDLAFHLSMTNDLIYGFEHGYAGYSTNHLHMGGFAVFNYAFYGPVTHYGAAIFTMLFRWAGATPSVGLKFMVVSAAILGGIYMYRLVMKMSKENRIISLITAAIFVFLPYRIFCALARCALAESIAMALIPMVFYGAYSFLHDKKWRVEPYVAFTVGAILIILSHAFTGLVTATFGFIYILFNAKNVFDSRKNYRALISIGASVLIIICCVTFYILNSFYYESTNLYNLSDAERQWTNYADVSSETSRTYDFSGFINIIFISRLGTSDWPASDTVTNLLFSSILYFVAMIIAVLVDVILRMFKASKYYRHPAAALSAFLFPIIFRVRVEVYLALAISLVLYFFISYLISTLPSDKEENEKPLYKNVDLYFLIVSIIICLFLLFVPEAWKLVPPIFYQAQFAWRMWSITAFLVAMLIGLLLSHFKAKKPLLVASGIVACGLMTLTMGTLEKRVVYSMKSYNVVKNDGYDFAMSIKYSGAQNEMVPQVFYQDGYTSIYANSLHSEIRSRIYGQRDFFYTLEDYIKPVVLEGTGDVTITKYNSPNNTFHVVIDSETALVQFPQFYYANYTMYSNGKSLGQAKNVDGLIAFTLKQGEYDAKLSFKPSKGYQLTIPLFYIGIFLLTSGGVFGYIYRKKWYKEEE